MKRRHGWGRRCLRWTGAFAMICALPLPGASEPSGPEPERVEGIEIMRSTDRDVVRQHRGEDQQRRYGSRVELFHLHAVDGE